jgi:hypothetical protein
MYECVYMSVHVSECVCVCGYLHEIVFVGVDECVCECVCVCERVSWCI